MAERGSLFSVSFSCFVPSICFAEGILGITDLPFLDEVFTALLLTAEFAVGVATILGSLMLIELRNGLSLAAFWTGLHNFMIVMIFILFITFSTCTY